MKLVRQMTASLFGLLLIGYCSLAHADNLRILTYSPLGEKGPNPACSTELCRSLKQLIDGAQQSIDFALYGYRGQKEILQSLLRAQQRGVRIRGVVDKTLEGRRGSHYYSDTKRLVRALSTVRDDYQSDLQTKRKIQKKLSYPFRGDLMHNKFFVVDGRHVWTGSANISDTGTGGYNANIVVLMDSKPAAAVYRKEFEQMYSGYYHRQKQYLRKRNADITIDGAEVSLYFSPQSFTVRRGLLPLIRQAQSSIHVMMFFLTHRKIAKELIAAHRRGVDVRIILDATGAANQYSRHQMLRKQGVPLKVESWGGKMHSKAAIIDGKHLVLGSMNWTKAGESKNDENTIIVRNAPRKAKPVEVYFASLWNSISDRWLRGRPLPESKASGTACIDGIDNDFDRLKDRRDPDCR